MVLSQWEIIDQKKVEAVGRMPRIGVNKWVSLVCKMPTAGGSIDLPTLHSGRQVWQLGSFWTAPTHSFGGARSSQNEHKKLGFNAVLG